MFKAIPVIILEFSGLVSSITFWGGPPNSWIVPFLIFATRADPKLMKILDVWKGTGIIL